MPGGAETLAQIAVEFFGSMGTLDADMDRAVDRARRAGDQAGQGFRDRFVNPLMQSIGALRQVQGEMASLLDFGSQVSGLGYAAQFQSLEVGFTTLLRDGDKAKKLLADIRDLGAQTPFDSSQLAAYTRQLMGAGVAAEGLLPALRSVTDTIAATGQGTEATGRLIRVLTQVRNIGLMGNDRLQFGNLGLDVGAIVGSALGRELKGFEAGKQALSGMSPQQQYETLLRGLDARFGGAAQKQGSQTLAGVAQNLTEGVKNAMLPTGQALLPLASGAANGAKSFIGVAQKANEATYGISGLIGIVSVGALLFRRYGQEIIQTTADMRLLGVAIRNLATGGLRATGAVIVQGSPVYVTGMVAGAGGITPAPLAIPSSAMAGGAATAGGAAALLSGLGAALPLLIPLGLTMAGGAMMASDDAKKRQLGGVISAVGVGAGIGAAAGGLIAGVGAVPGMLVGALLGLIVGAVSAEVENKKLSHAREDHTQQLVDNTGKMIAELKELRSQLVGGGKRSQFAMSGVETQYALYHLMTAYDNQVG